jgi:hypothetical protein
MSTYTLAKLKTPKSRQGVAVYADLMRDDVKVATIADEGNGGAMFIDYVNADEEKAFTEFAVEVFTKMADDEFGAEVRSTFATSERSQVEFWINRTVDLTLTAKSFDRQAKKKTIYRVEGERRWSSVTVPYSARVLELLEQRHGAGKIVSVWGAFGEQTV